MSILFNVKEIQAKVREAMENGPVTPYYTLPLDKVYELLNAALASEIICVLRYKQHYYMTTSIHQEQLQGLFKEHWLDEERHLELIADRIKQLGGVPNLDPGGINKRAFSSFESGHTLADLLREDLLAERVVIKIYSDIVTFFGDADPVTGACSRRFSKTRKITRTKLQICSTRWIRRPARPSSNSPAIQ